MRQVILDKKGEIKAGVGRWRAGVGAAAAVLLVVVLAAIWVLTEQTPEQTTALSLGVAYSVDDAAGHGRAEDAPAADSDARADDVRGSADATGDSAAGGSDQIAISSPSQPVRVGDEVRFEVYAPDAVAYRWEMTDAGTEGWYTPGVGAVDGAVYSFTLPQDRAWMASCEYRCEVTFADGSVAYSEPGRFELKDMGAANGLARRAAHVVEFGAVGLLCAIAVASFWWGRVRAGRLIAATLAFCFACSVGDQTHKLFVPGREFDCLDLLLDAAGYVGAAAVVFGLCWLRGRRARGARRR